MSGAQNSANEWYISFLANRSVEIKRKIAHNSKSDGYLAHIGTIFSNKITANAFYRINAFFYDISTSQMFGKPCHTTWTISENQECHFDEDLFFHSPNIDDQILLILEFVEKETDRTPSKSIGWIKKVIQAKNEPIHNFSSIPPGMQLKKIDVLSGTPKLLVFNETPKEITGSVEFELFTHSKLHEVLNYFPEFCLITKDDNIPGIQKVENEPFLHQPVKEPLVSASLDDVSLVFGPDASRIEKIIIDEILHEWCLKENQVRNEKPNASIIERRLKIGVHNGYCYLSEPLSINLSASNSNLLSNNSLLRKRRTMSSSDLRNGEISLFVNSRISIPNLFEDPHVALIFLVEYTFLHENQLSQPILIGWGAWKPFSTQHDTNRHNIQASVSLVGGPRPNPEGLLCFRNLLHLHKSDDSVFTESQPQISITFSFYLEQLKIESRPSTHRSEYIANRITPTPRSGRKSGKQEDHKLPEPIEFPKINTSRSISSEEEIRAISNDMDKIIEIAPTDQIEEPDSPRTFRTYSIPLDESRPSNFPRSVYSLFARTQFTSIKDRNGDLPITEDVNNKGLIDMNREKFDPLDGSQFFFQFIAFKQLNSNLENRQIHQMFFTIQFYRFPQLTSESLVLKQLEKNEPSILTRIVENGSNDYGNNLGFIAKYIVESDEEKSDFLEYLLTGHAVIDIWNSESLMYIGSTLIPLKNLLRRGRESVQLYLQCPVVDNSGLMSRNSAGLEAKSTNSLIYLRVVNVGYASANRHDTTAGHVAGTVVRRMTSSSRQFAEEGPHTYRIHAKPLNSDSAGNGGIERFLKAQRLDIQQRHEELFNEESLEKIRKWNDLKKGFNFENHKTLAQKFIFEEELAAYKKLRFESKPARLLEAVFKGITTCHEIRPCFGENIFFEFPLENCCSDPINCTIEIDDQALRPIVDEEEWRFFKNVHKLKTPMERDLIRESLQRIEVYLKPGETVFVPFVYDAFYFPNDHFDMYSTKVVFRRWDNQEPLSILDLRVNRRNQLINHNVIFIAESNRNFDKQLLLPAMFKDRRAVSSRCSDPSVKCAIRNSSLQQILSFTTFVGESAGRKSFLLIMYSDHFKSRILATWNITILSLLRIDVRGIIGQTSKTNIVVKRSVSDGNLADLLNVYTNSSIVRVETTLLADQQPTFSVDFTPTYSGTRNFVISVINTNTGKLEAGYLIFAKSETPRISRKILFNIPIDKEDAEIKQIPIKNPYGIPRTFRISTSRSDILKISDPLVNVPGMSTSKCDIFFVTISHKPMNIEMLIYITNAENNIQEEVYSVTVKYY